MPKSQQPDEGVDVIKQLILSNPDNRVLDIGFGFDCKWGKTLKDRVQFIDGVEAFPGNMVNAPFHYRRAVNCDIMNFEFDQEYDVAILGDVLEHLDKDDAITLIARLKQHVKEIYLIIPACVCVQDAVAGNIYEVHKYHWSDRELRFDLGFNLLRFDLNDNHLVVIGSYVWRKQ